MEKALSFFREKQLDSFKKYTDLSSNYSKQPKSLEKVHFFLATYYKYSKKPDSAYYHYHQSKNISLQLGDSITTGKRLYNIALLLLNENNILASEIAYISALKNLEKTNFHTIKYYIYNNLGLIAKEREELQEALKYFDLSLQELKKDSIKNYNLRLNTFNNKGLLYQHFNQHQKAITYFMQGLNKDSIEQKYPTQYALLLENLTYSNYSLGNKEKVLEQYNEVLSIRKKLHNYSGMSTTHINLSNYFKDLNLTKKALFHSNEALKYAKQTHNNKRWLEALKNLANLTKGEESKQYLFEYITLNDSLFQNERRLKNQFAKIRYETDKKEKENVVLKTENQQKQAEITYQKQQKTIGWLVALSGLLFSGFSVLFYFQRKRKILYQAQLQKVEAREHERQQIAKSLHDEVAGDLRLLHQKLEKSNLLEEAVKLNSVKENVRNLSHQLSSISFDKVSFKDQIINLVSDYFELDFKIKVYGIQDYDWTTIDNSIKRLLYLSTRESIQNCKKYAKASTITIYFSVHKKYVHLNITDNGVGFNTEVSKKGIGLQNLQERVEELNGTLTITSEIGKGTQTHIQIPFHV
ncbi:tetratricopeptide repeat-containing sensor histidine kinase [Tenacibaculum sp. L6]|uniref:tetratricopeptide repeat-containing sensor histidine kinase n=1 Tax=Tenacibaculum sp. L6 TaxID=2992764 RepID=UPI00237C4152|nr:tetratricopeptide repeat protein [Tenacibaculum sp. L6]MDE0536632.1 tetratricopeptide repeat protein [Tenacibaculum sp. L6]